MARELKEILNVPMGVCATDHYSSLYIHRGKYLAELETKEDRFEFLMYLNFIFESEMSSMHEQKAEIAKQLRFNVEALTTSSNIEQDILTEKIDKCREKINSIRSLM